MSGTSAPSSRLACCCALIGGYRKALEIIRAQPENYDQEFAEVFVKLVDKLDPPTAGQTT